jgi:predicted nuclease of restriction endonuclease-like (RecB) superfamily
MDKRFTDIIQLIKQSRINAIKSVNAELINLYLNIGEYICKKIELSEWGDSVVTELARYIQHNEPDIKGFSDKNIWRMKQFYESYKDFPKLSTLLREISWSHNLTIFSRCKTKEEREFYLKLAKLENYSFRELDRQISASLFERTMIGNLKLSTALRENNQGITNTF